MNKPKHAWMVRAGDDNELADLVEEKGAVAIGWDSMGDVSALQGREAFKERYREVYPDHSAGRVAVNAGQIFRYVCEIREGDYVLTYRKASREVFVGLAAGPHKYDPNLFSDYYPQVRPVSWIRRLSRDVFSTEARNSMGSTLTVFNLDDHLSEIHQKTTAVQEPVARSEKVEEAAPPFFAEIRAKADELIADLVSRLDPYDFQDLVAAVLRAMGFRAVSNPPGRDRGIDIVAHPDPLGFERPRIKVQVKHRKDAAGGPDMREFLGALKAGDSGLFVSTGDFRPDAKLAAENSAQPVTLLNRDGFIQLLLEHYEALDPEFKAQVPLRKVWVPAE